LYHSAGGIAIFSPFFIALELRHKKTGISDAFRDAGFCL
jgi:hypothetical protein